MWVSASQSLTWLLALVATGMLEITAGTDERSSWMTAIVVAVEALLVVGLHSGLRWTGWSERTVRSRLSWVLVLALLPWGAELALRFLLHRLWPLELSLLAGFRDGVLALAVFAHEPRSQRMCCVMSTFLVIFASALAVDAWVQGLVILFAVLGVWWLMGSYWESLQGRLAASSEQGLPRKWAILLPLLVLVCLTAIPVAGTQVRALRGIVPSSGGTDVFSEAARSGLGNGDALVAGSDNIQSFAPMEDATSQASQEPSLYDVYSDVYEEPFDFRKQQRTISLEQEFTHQAREHRVAQSQIAGKEFSTLRKPSGKRRKERDDRTSDAVMYVSGRVPLHLKLRVFNLYDGIDWYPQPLANRESPLKMESLDDRTWLRIPLFPGPAIYAPPELHAVKIVKLKSNHVPSATQLMAFHIDELDQLDMFQWAQPGVVKLERDWIPSLTVIHEQSRVVDRRRFDPTKLEFHGRAVVYQQFGDDPQSLEVRRLAQEWTRGIKGDWPQVRAIEERLRHDYILDDDARPPEDCTHTVADFLFRSKRGPDYLFASAAVYMVRSLGHSARLVSGFYADDRHYDTRLQHTPVLPEDVHFWAEVNCGRDHWIPIEPTPGYALLQPPPTVNTRVADTIAAVKQFVAQHPLTLTALGMAGIFTVWRRKRLRDRLSTALWQWHSTAQPRRLALRTAQLLDARTRRAGLPRPMGLTTSRWLLQLSQQSLQTDDVPVNDLVALIDWASYAPQESGCPVANPAAVCRSAERTWNWRRLTQLAAAERQSRRAARLGSSSTTPESISLSPLLRPAQGIG